MESAGGVAAEASVVGGGVLGLLRAAFVGWERTTGGCVVGSAWPGCALAAASPPAASAPATASAAHATHALRLGRAMDFPTLRVTPR